MKLLITLDFPPEVGGIQRYLNDIVRHTYTINDLVIVGGFYKRNKGQMSHYPCRIHRISLPVFVLNKKWLLVPMMVLLIGKLWQFRNKMVVYAGNIYAALLPCVLSFFIPVRYHVYCYGTELLPLNNKRSIKACFGKVVLKRAEKIYYLTKTTRELLARPLGMGPFIRMSPKIDLPTYIVKPKNGGEAGVHLLSVGRLVPHKGHAVLLNAVSDLSDNIVWKLSVVGNGPEYSSLISQIRTNGIDDKVSLCTNVPDKEMPQYYKKADIFIFPSISTECAVEGFGIVLLEAMAYGAAIIASRSGGIEDVVTAKQKVALLVPPGKPVPLREAICNLIYDKELRFRLACNGRQLLEERYVW
jgi:glycosyltransferase involved in cell wall biosynthesis